MPTIFDFKRHARTALAVISLLALALHLAGDPLRNHIEFNEDSARDILHGLAVANGGPLPTVGPAVNQLDFSLGPHWYGFVAALLTIGRSATTLLLARWALQLTTAALFFVLARRLFDGFVAAAATVLLLWSAVFLEVFSWYTHPMMAMPLALAALLSLERWATTRRPIHAVAAAALAGLALQVHFSVAVLLPMGLVTSAFVGRLPARWAALTVAAVVLTFFPTSAHPIVKLIVIRSGTRDGGMILSVVPVFALAGFALLWRGGEAGVWRRSHRVVGALLSVVWLIACAVTIGRQRIAGVSFYNITFLRSGPTLGGTDWGHVAADVLTVLSRDGIARPSSTRCLLVGALLVAGLAWLIREALRGDARARATSRLVLMWLGWALPSALVSCRTEAAGRYLMLLAPLACMSVAALLVRGWQRLPKLLGGVVALVFLSVVASVARRGVARSRHALERPAQAFDPCRRGMLESLALYHRLRAEGLSPREIGARVHGLLGPDEPALSFGTFAFVRAVLDDGEASATTAEDGAHHYRLMQRCDGHAVGGPVVERFEPSFDMRRVEIQRLSTSGGLVALPFRRPPLQRSTFPLLPPVPIDDQGAGEELDFTISRRAGRPWSDRIEVVAFGRGQPCQLTLSAPGARVVESSPRQVHVHVTIDGLPPTLDRLRVHIHGCRVETFDAWDSAARTSPTTSLPR